jgi:hypothetical protein
MDHNTEAQWAAIEIAKCIIIDNNIVFSQNTATEDVFAVKPPTTWPRPDALVTATTTNDKYAIAVEYKRIKEGRHGVLTAMGQALGYIHKGYSGVLLVVPKSYPDEPDTGAYTKSVLDFSCKDKPIGVFTYDPTLNILSSSSFAHQIHCDREISLDTQSVPAEPEVMGSQQAWAFVREGETTPNVVFRWMQTAKTLRTTYPNPFVSDEIKAAVERVKPGVDVYKYLAWASSNLPHDRIWRSLFFEYILHEEMQTIWTNDNPYTVNPAAIRLLQWDGISPMERFGAARTDSIKNKIVEKLNTNEITETEAWEMFVKNIHERAHSFRETIDSGIDAIELIDEHGNPTMLGYKFVDACKNNDDNANASTPMAILRHAYLKHGKFADFLQYVFETSESKFRDDPSAFVNNNGQFQEDDYLYWLGTEFHDTLRVINKVAQRGGVERKPFQAERTILKKFGLLTGNMRAGVGLEINWPAVQEALEYPA